MKSALCFFKNIAAVIHEIFNLVLHWYFEIDKMLMDNYNLTRSRTYSNSSETFFVKLIFSKTIKSNLTNFDQ